MDFTGNIYLFMGVLFNGRHQEDQQVLYNDCYIRGNWIIAGFGHFLHGYHIDFNTADKFKLNDYITLSDASCFTMKVKSEPCGAMLCQTSTSLPCCTCTIHAKSYAHIWILNMPLIFTSWHVCLLIYWCWQSGAIRFLKCWQRAVFPFEDVRCH